MPARGCGVPSRPWRDFRCAPEAGRISRPRDAGNPAWEPPDLLTERQAAKLLGVSYPYLCRWRNGIGRARQKKPFPFHPLVNAAGLIRYQASEVRAYARQLLLTPAPATRATE